MFLDNDEKKMTQVTAKVTEMFDGESAKEYLLINGHLKVTPNHRFYSKGEWVEIGKLKEGDVLFDQDGQEIAINKLEKVESQNSIQVYNLEVEGEHNYYADGLLVHNKLSYNPPAVSGVPVTSGVITRYVGSLSEETKGAWVNHVFLGSTKIATVTSSEVRYYLQDHLGSTNVVTNSAGTMIELNEYKPFGAFSRHDQFGTSNAAWYYFTGKPLDDETGLMFYGARYYSPVIGRFITADPTVQYQNDPQDLNRFAYCRNNPINLTDPTGLGFKKWFTKTFGDYGEIMGLASSVLLGPYGFQAFIAASGYTKNWKPLQNMATSATSGFLFGGPLGAASAVFTSAVMNSKPGQQATQWLANEVYDDMLGFSPKLAYMIAYIDLSMATGNMFESGYANLTAERGMVTDFDINNPEHYELIKNSELNGYNTFGSNPTNPKADIAWTHNANLKVITGSNGKIALWGEKPYGAAVHTGASSPNFSKALNMRLPNGSPKSIAWLQKGTTFGFCHQAANATLLNAGFSNVTTQLSNNFSTYVTTFVYGNYGGGLVQKAINGYQADRNWK